MAANEKLKMTTNVVDVSLKESNFTLHSTSICFLRISFVMAQRILALFSLELSEPSTTETDRENVFQKLIVTSWDEPIDNIIRLVAFQQSTNILTELIYIYSHFSFAESQIRATRRVCRSGDTESTRGL